jgi:hypothetical protein
MTGGAPAVDPAGLDQVLLHRDSLVDRIETGGRGDRALDAVEGAGRLGRGDELGLVIHVHNLRARDERLDGIGRGDTPLLRRGRGELHRIGGHERGQSGRCGARRGGFRRRSDKTAAGQANGYCERASDR